MKIELNKASAIYDIIDGDVVIINLINGNYYNLTGTGAYLWDLIRHSNSLNSILNSLINEFDVDATQAERDLRIFLDQLKTEQLIIQTDNSEFDKPNGRKNTEAKKKYQPPLLETFSDMQDFLLVDPIHEVDENGLPKYTPPPTKHV